MTVVAWDGTTLAADKRAVVGSTIYSVTKIQRIDDDRMIGISGALGFGQQIVEWLRNGSTLADYPKHTDGKGDEGEKDTFVLVVHRSGLLHLHEASAYPIVVESPQWALGCGKQLALMAMRCGKSAEEAVALTFEFDAWCGNGIDTLSFEEP